jgi:excisionase family DNA binding protein
MSEKLLTAEQVADARGLKERTVIRLRKEHKIPSVKLGYRTFLFRLSAVDAALGRLEEKAVSARKGGGR